MKALSGVTARILVLAGVLISVPAIFVIDVYFTPWRVPTRVLYAIPVMIAARVFGTSTATITIVLAIGFSILDAWLVGVDIQGDVRGLANLVQIPIQAPCRLAPSDTEERAGRCSGITQSD